MSQEPKVPETVSIGELARSCGTTLRAVRWYTEQGLLQSCGTQGNCALYPAGSAATVRRIQALQEAGLALGDIRSLFALINANNTRGKQLTTTLRAVALKQLESIRERERELARIRKALDQLVKQTSGCDTCKARGPEHDCSGCGNLEALKTLGSVP
jgi:DNA-binding transcriptional MerR regulator